jgi:hypothetical protein
MIKDQLSVDRRYFKRTEPTIKEFVRHERRDNGLIGPIYFKWHYEPIEDEL